MDFGRFLVISFGTCSLGLTIPNSFLYYLFLNLMNPNWVSQEESSWLHESLMPGLRGGPLKLTQPNSTFPNEKYGMEKKYAILS